MSVPPPYITNITDHRSPNLYLLRLLYIQKNDVDRASGSPGEKGRRMKFRELGEGWIRELDRILAPYLSEFQCKYSSSSSSSSIHGWTTQGSVLVNI